MGLPSRIGVIGGGQLAWMMAKAAPALGLELIVQTPHPQDPAVAAAAGVVWGSLQDLEATAELARQCRVITFENEFVDLEGLGTLAAAGVCFRPSLTSLTPLLDKYHQRCFLRDLGLPVPRFIGLDQGADSADLAAAVAALGLPLVVKTRRHGYDGQGTFILRDPAELPSLGSQPVLLETYVPFVQELAVVAARSLGGEVVFYPPTTTYQRDQVCRWALAPALVSPAVVAELDRITRVVLETLRVVGVWALEFFLTATGELLVNEIAPRTHNSGHYTLDACPTSQFEQHLRAVAGFPLGETQLHCPGAVMVNLLGYEHAQGDYLRQRQLLAALPGAHLHWYGKGGSRPGRKLGHVTILLGEGSSLQTQERIREVEALWYPDSP